MALLQVLNLPVPKRFAAQIAAKAGSDAPPPPMSADTDEARATVAAKPPGNGAKGTPPKGDPRLTAEATKVHGTIVAKREEARTLLANLNKLAPELDKMIAVRTGDAKKEFEAKKAVLQKKTAEAVKTIDAANADLEALDNPQSRQEEVVKILAKHGAGGSRATEVEMDTKGLKPGTPRNHDVTTTTTSYDKGKAIVEKQRDQSSLGVGGYTKTTSTDKEVTSSTLTARSGAEKKTQVSLAGKASVETKKTAEVELPDGRKAGVERTEATEISRKGASQTKTEKKTNFDGSSTANTTTRSLEREDGKLVAKSGTSTTTTTATGTATKRDTNVTFGGVNNKDGVGATGALEKGKTVTSKGGHQAGLVAGVHANVMCNVGKPSGDPPLYPVTLTVSFGGSVGASGGTGKKEGSKGSLDVSVQASEDRSMTITHMLSEADLGGYVKALQDASKRGGKPAAGRDEFAIIATGVNQGWDAARRLWKGDGAIDKKTTDGMKRAGDSIEKSETSGRGGSLKGKLGPVGGGIGQKDTDEHSTKVTRNDKGGLDVEGKGAHTRERSLSGSLDAGAASLEIGSVHTHKTSFGYSIIIDPKNDPDGKMLADLSRCKTGVDYNIFLMSHVGKVEVKGITRGHGDADATNVGVGVAGVKLGMGTHQGVDVETTKDIKGKVTHQKVTGHAGAGGTLGPLADSVDEDAVAEVDEKGHAELTLTRTTKDNHNSRARDRQVEKLKQKVGLAKKKDDAAQGGEEDDSTVKDVSGLKLTHKELKTLGAKFLGPKEVWIGRWRRADEKADWIKCGAAIARGKGAPGVVAEELARFIGSDRVERMHTVEQWIRGGWATIKMGQAFEFPDAIRSVQADYDTVMEDGLPKRLDALAAKDAAKAVEECKRLQALAAAVMGKVSACNDFSNPGTKGEMLHHLQVRRDMFTSAINGYAGKPVDDLERLKKRADEWMKLCSDYYVQQAKLLGDLSDLIGNDKHFLVRDLGDANKLLHQLDDLHNRWWPYFAELKGVMKKLGNPNFDLPTIKPDDAALKFYQKAVS
jgi:hypothetical protein